jgi:arsenate reductase
MDTKRVLFVCIHNSARSQMAEAYLNAFSGGVFVAESAGLEPRPVNPLVIEAMREEGFDLSGARADSIMEFYREGRLYDTVIYVCEREVEEGCPVFPGVTHIERWPFPDPSKLEGTEEEQLARIRPIRDAIREKVRQWLGERGVMAN